MVIQKRTQLIFIMSFVIAFLSLCIYKTNKSLAISRACQNSAECRAAAEKEEAANAAASEAANTANSYKREVAYKNSEIATKEAQIAETTAQINQLIAEIEVTEAKLTKQQTALAKLLTNMHFNYNNEPVVLLASADSISDLAEKKAREDTAKEQITNASQEIKILKNELEEKRTEAENNLAVQKLAEAELVKARSELQELVSKYESDSASYSAQAEEARLAKIAAEKAEQEAHPELYRVGSYYGSTDSYEWKGYCPTYQDAFTTYYNGYAIGGYVCECVSYAGWKAYEAYGVALSWGNAYSWDDYGRLYYVVDHNPAPNTIGQMDSGAYGHVFWVESVNWDGSINVTEYNNAYATYLYSGIYQYGSFGARTIPAYEANSYNYIHLDQRK